MVGVGLQQFLEAAGVEAASHLGAGAGDSFLGGGDLRLGRGSQRQVPDQIRPCGTADLQQKQMAACVDQLSQNEI